MGEATVAAPGQGDFVLAFPQILSGGKALLFSAYTAPNPGATTAPPSAEIFFSSPPALNPIHWLSGEKKGATPADPQSSVGGTGEDGTLKFRMRRRSCGPFG